MNTLFILTSDSTDYITNTLNYYSTEIKQSYLSEGYTYNLFHTDNSIIIETNSPYIFNIENSEFSESAVYYNTRIKVSFISLKGENEEYVYYSR